MRVMPAVIACLALLAIPATAAAAPVVTTYTAGLNANDRLWGVTLGPDGAVWFADNQPKGVGSVATSGTISLASTTVSSGPLEIVTGPDGNLWVTENENKVAMITPLGARTE